jgi:hypothetical protein
VRLERGSRAERPARVRQLKQIILRDALGHG